MKKRLRKKKRVGEFIDWGFEYKATISKNAFTDKYTLDNFVDDFMDLIDSFTVSKHKRVYCGGGFGEEHVNMFIECYNFSKEKAFEIREKIKNHEFKIKYSNLNIGEIVDTLDN